MYCVCFILRQDGDHEFTVYRQALDEYLDKSADWMTKSGI